MLIRKILITITLAIVCIGLVPAYPYLTSASCGACHFAQRSTYVADPHHDAGIGCNDCHPVSIIGDMELRGSKETVTIPLIGEEELISARIEYSLSLSSMTLLHLLDEYEAPVTNVSMYTCLGCHPPPDTHPHISREDCSFCHSPHKTRELKDFMEYECDQCHDGVTMVGIHEGVTCRGCHVRHAHIPDCILCHSPHTEVLMDNADCMTCHRDPHTSPGTIFSRDVPKEACAACHKREYDALTKGNTKHDTFAGTHYNYAMGEYDFTESCFDCHPQHGQIRSCMDSRCHRDHHVGGGCAFPACHLFNFTERRFIIEFGCDRCHVDPHAP